MSKRNSEFYKKVYAEAGISELQIKTVADIKKIPIVDKEMMRSYGFESVLTSAKKENLVYTITSGTNGKPIQVFTTKKEHFTSYVRTFLCLRGFNPFKFFGVIGVVDQKEKIEKQSFLYYCQRFLGLFRRESFSVSTPVEEVIARLENKRINYLSTMPSCYKVLIAELKRTKKELSVKYVVTAGETMDDDLREDIKKYLQAKIINVYGCMEHSSMAWTKPDGDTFSYPLNSVFIEYVNPIEQDGELYGELVITNLINKTMPFVRYKIGDHVKILGSNRKMGTIKGRADDIIELEDGRNIYMMQLYHFSRIKGLYQYKFLQKKDKRICFQAVCKPGFNTQIIRDTAIEIWNKNIGKHPFEVEFRDELPINPISGKFKKMEVEK